jgi:peptidyl-prolyl cis-trans isomerase D
MFDLFRSRDKAVRYLLGGLLGVVALSMVVTLIPGYGTPSQNREMIVAEVGKDQITVRQVQLIMQNVVRSKRVPQEMIQHYVPQLIDQMITERAVAFQAERMGFRVSDEEVANAIRSMLPQMLGSGEFDRNLYTRYLQQQGLSVDEFERNIRTNLLLLRLQNIALEGAIVTPTEVEQEYHHKNDKVKVEYVAWTPKDIRSEATVSPEEIQAFYNQNKTMYMSPERRSFHLLIADEAKIGATVQTNEDQLRAAYSKNLDKYRTPERLKVRHILVMTNGKPKEELPKLEAKANDILKQVKAGGDFAALAKQYSDDPGSKDKGGEYDGVVRGQMDPAFEQAAFALKPKEISNLVKTQYGFHILQLLDREPAKVKSFEEVKAELAAEQKRESVYNLMQSAVEKARAELVKSPNNAQQIAEKYNLTYANAQNVGRGEPVPEAGVSGELESNVTSLKAGEVSQIFQLAPTKLAVAAVTAVQPPRQSTLQEVEATVRETLTNRKVGQLSEQRVRETMEKLKSLQSSGDLKSVAKAIGGEVRTTQFFTSDGAADGIGPASYLPEAFSKPAGTTLAPFNLGNQVFLAKVVEKQVADPSGLNAAREPLVLSLKQRKAQERKDLFEDGVMTRLIKEGKVKKNQDTIKRLVNQYQS